jgi:hydroxypyruvate reductase
MPGHGAGDPSRLAHARKHALEIFRAALAAADPDQAVQRAVKFDGRYLTAGRRYDLNRFDRIQLIGAGKASRAMAQALERLLGRRLHAGFVNVPDGGATPLRRVTLNAASHPVPDERGEDGARRILQIAQDAGPRDLLLCVISGGASALLPLPAAPLTLAEKQEITRRLLASGATIHQMNTVRKHLSQIKGGQLAKAAWPATLVTLILSDVTGDDLSTIGSGPTVPDPSTARNARDVLEHFKIPAPTALHETPKSGDAVFRHVKNLVIGSNRLALDEAARKAKELGYRTLLLSSFIEGETREVAKVHAAIAKEVLTHRRPVRMPACILSGGETTVTIRGDGKGGRNQEFVLAAALALQDFGPAVVFSCGTDGIDGPTDAAGAYVDSSTLARARLLDLDPGQYLNNNDSYHFFERLEALIKTGPTGTNVMDVRMILLPGPV